MIIFTFYKIFFYLQENFKGTFKNILLKSILNILIFLLTSFLIFLLTSFLIFLLILYLIAYTYFLLPFFFMLFASKIVFYSYGRFKGTFQTILLTFIFSILGLLSMTYFFYYIFYTCGAGKLFLICGNCYGSKIYV